MGIGADARLALRSLRRSKGYTLATVVLLTLGIGANATIFTAVRAALLAPLPFPNADELIVINLVDIERGGSLQWSWPRLSMLMDHLGPGTPAVGAYGTASLRFGGTDGTVAVPFEVVEPNYFDILGIPFRLGPGFSDDSEGAEVVLAHGFWTSAFGADTGILGHRVAFEGVDMTVVGVAAEGFDGLSGDADGWLPLSNVEEVLGAVRLGPDAHWLQGIGRLQGQSLVEVEDRVALAGREVAAAYPDEARGQPLGARVERLVDARVNHQARRSLLILSGAALLLFLVTMAHIGGLALARAWQRKAEMDVRRALGSGMGALLRLHLVEAGILAAIGWLGACIVTLPGSRLLARLWPDRFLDGAWQVRFVDPAAFRVDASVLLFGLGLAALGTLVAGLGSFVRVAPAAGTVVRTGAGSPPRTSLLRDGLLIVQTGVTLALLVGFELLVATAGHLRAVATGIDPTDVLSFRVSLPQGSPWLDRPDALATQLAARIRALPGVSGVGQGCPPLYGRHCAFGSVEAFEGRELGEGAPRFGVQVVDAAYLEVLGIRTNAGEWSSLGEGDAVFVLSGSAAAALGAGRDPLGSTLRLGPIWGRRTGLEGTVRGVVDDVLYDPPQLGTMPEVFVLAGWMPDGQSYLVKSRGGLSVVPRIREILRAIDPQLVLTDPVMLSALAGRATADTTLALRLLMAFALLGLAVSALGVSAMVAQGVQARRREVAIRMALGAKANDVVGLLLRRTLVLGGIGIALGVGLTIVGAEALQAILFEVEATDPRVIGGGVGLLAAVCFVAAWMPASGAATVSPMEVLRTE